MRYTAEKRRNDAKAQKRRVRLLRSKFNEPFDEGFPECNAKKVSFSSPWKKTNNKGARRLRHGNYAPSKNWSHRDLKAIQSAEDQIKNAGMAELVDAEDLGSSVNS